MKQNFLFDEQMMILVFAQWCINHELDPRALYQQAFPGQIIPPALEQAISLTVPKEEAGEIADDTVLGVLSLYDQPELAELVRAEITKQS
ncbi:hypothetical protein M3212_08455 [Alkalihalobacillus oceani]|uniref:hypothetical protein n=1 Tax=Halalkalibacter oceani TaxID=1653776 RepID=UPI00204175E1|nr:hypothetical protein [Halalkalibacter oceani]MCM3760819.1 hypothetical protein [Halalkalibacter oceani]